ncbi:preprotein translocase subunit SecG [Pedobacter sp. LMG 31464]|uniref:Protein-export membrane protein SecG n=1 Tax=Pedobacter planticolens TaxID=2679964 RepID=A0A923DYW5_9SPHI|nr:preprotein translocase subunit SecG [Pedobacter planticolens]MBB2146601.1 preprotein translocase subunit SecG [Pedobacter planticolens]
MVTLLIILLIIFCIALGLFVLIQNPKGGGLATGGSGSNMFGVQRTGDVLEKGTWVLLTLIVVASLALTTVGKSGNGSTATGSKIDEQINKAATPSVLGGGAPAPATTTPAATPKTGDTTKK